MRSQYFVYYNISEYSPLAYVMFEINWHICYFHFIRFKLNPDADFLGEFRSFQILFMQTPNLQIQLI